MFNIFRGLFSTRSNQWNKVRKEHLTKYNECFICRRRTDLDVHHIVPVHVNPDRELDPDNLITLCGKYCHFIFGHLMDWKSWNPNIRSDATMFRNRMQTKPYKEEK